MMRWGNMMNGYGHGFYSGNVFFSLACQLIFIIVIFIVALVLFRHSKKKTNNLRTNDPALSILNERFAKGELSAEEYNKMKQNLSE